MNMFIAFNGHSFRTNLCSSAQKLWKMRHHGAQHATERTLLSRIDVVILNLWQLYYDENLITHLLMFSLFLTKGLRRYRRASEFYKFQSF